MVLKTYACISAISLSLLFCFSAQVLAQSEGENSNKTPAIEYPLYNGLTVGIDVFGPASKVLGSDFFTTEVSVAANLKNRFFPIAEIGFGTTDATNDDLTHYKSSAPYFRLGMNYNTMYKKNGLGFLYVGLRYGFSSFSYDVMSMDVEDPIWGGSAKDPGLSDPIWGVELPPYDRRGEKATMHWMELVCGIQVHIYKELHMGWSVRMKYRVSSSLSQYGDPWFVPGFGKYDSSQMGITYSLIYKLPF